MFYPAVTSNLRLRFYFNSGVDCVISTSSPTLRMDSLYLQITGINYASDLFAQKMAEWRSAVHLFPDVAVQYKSMPVGAVSAGVNSGQQTLNQPGTMSGVLFQLYDNAVTTPQSKVVPLPLDQCQFYLSNGQVYNSGAYTKNVLRFVSSEQFPTSDQIGNSSDYREGSTFIQFCNYLRDALVKHSVHGNLVLQGSEQVQVMPTANPVTSGVVEAYLYQLGLFSIGPDGNASYTRL